MGQDALFKISKAYAVYDEEVGYCQGLSFLAAALLLHVSHMHFPSLYVISVGLPWIVLMVYNPYVLICSVRFEAKPS